MDTMQRFKQQIGFMKDEFSYRLDKLFGVFWRYCQANSYFTPKKPAASSIQNPSMSLMRPKFPGQTIPNPPFFDQIPGPGQGSQSDMYNYLMRMMNMMNANKEDPNFQTYNINCRLNLF